MINFSYRDVRLGQDDEGYFLKCPNKKEHLTPMEFKLLGTLMANAGQIVTRNFLLANVWHYNWYGDSGTLDVHICTLRRKLGDNGRKKRVIKTIKGIGYKFSLS